MTPNPAKPICPNCHQPGTHYCGRLNMLTNEVEDGYFSCQPSVVCPRCAGKGRLRCDKIIPGLWKDCERCHGSGRIAQPEQPEQVTATPHKPMIQIQKSATADTRTCDFANVSAKTLLDSSRQHIGDVVKGLSFFIGKLTEAAGCHDYDKLTDINWFHSDFLTGFKETGWWDNHRKIHRHHLAQEDGVPADVNLLDILEYITDCVMAGKARSGTVTPLLMTPELLERAFKNTVDLLASQVEVAPPQ